MKMENQVKVHIKRGKLKEIDARREMRKKKELVGVSIRIQHQCLPLESAQHSTGELSIPGELITT